MTGAEKSINRAQKVRKPLPETQSVRDIAMTTEDCSDIKQAADRAAYFVRGAVLANGGKVRVTVTAI